MVDSERNDATLSEVGDRLRDAVDEIKPRLRGWLHAATWPLALAAFVVLICLAPGAAGKTGAAVYMASALLLFGVSALYHTRKWKPSVHAMLRRFDHANIFVLIAGSYTAFSLILLDHKDATVLLSLVWSAALIGVFFGIVWIDAPRWLHVPLYLALGWTAIFWAGDFARSASTAVIVLIIAGGVLYTLGAVVYGFQRPDPFPGWFGFHEVFHSLTIAAFAVHYVGVSMAAYAR